MRIRHFTLTAALILGTVQAASAKDNWLGAWGFAVLPPPPGIATPVTPPAIVPLAPLHQPYNLAAIEAVFERLPGVPQVACFDTSFHHSNSAVAALVPLPRDMCKSGLRRYGFHGLSYEYIASVLPEMAPEIARGASSSPISGVVQVCAL